MTILNNYVASMKNRFAPVTQNLSDITCLKGKPVGIDGMIWVMQAKKTSDKRRADQTVTDYIVASVRDKCIKLTDLGIDLLIVFDGLVPTRKQEINVERKHPVTETIRVSSNMISMLKKLRIKYVIAAFEADATLSYLMQTGKIYAVFSEDGDMIARSIERVVYHWDATHMTCRFFQMERVRAAWDNLFLGGISPLNMLLLAIFHGSDYNNGFKIRHKSDRQNFSLDLLLPDPKQPAMMSFLNAKIDLLKLIRNKKIVMVENGVDMPIPNVLELIRQSLICFTCQTVCENTQFSEIPEEFQICTMRDFYTLIKGKRSVTSDKPFKFEQHGKNQSWSSIVTWVVGSKSGSETEEAAKSEEVLR